MANPRYSHRSLLVFFLFLALILSCQISVAQTNAKRTGWRKSSDDSGVFLCDPPNIWFGRVGVGQTEKLSARLINRTPVPVTVLRVSSTASGFKLSNLPLPLTVQSGQSVTFNVSFTPQRLRTQHGTFAVINNSKTSHLVFGVHGHGQRQQEMGVLSASPSSLSFGTVQPESSKTLAESLTNSGRSSLTISRISPVGAGFGVSGLNLPLTLAPGQSFTFGAVFAPESGGNATGSIAVISTASNPALTIPLSGGGTSSGQLTESPRSLNFNNVAVGTSKSLPITLSATKSSVTISSATTNNSEFKLSGVTLPLTLAAGKSASFNLNFTPQSSGASSGTISFVSNASNSPTPETVTGTGTSTTGHSVNLSWNPSKSPVIGYNIYRGSVSGGPYVQINTAIDSSTSYIDTTVLAHSTYYYVSTSVARNGTESGFSNQVKAAVP